jgi:hypothetical protein
MGASSRPQASRHLVVCPQRSPSNLTIGSKNIPHTAGTTQNRRTIMTAGLAIRALATNNRRRSVARAKLTAIYAAPGSLRKGLKRADRLCAAASHTVKSYRAPGSVVVEGSRHVADNGGTLSHVVTRG